jgi:hypothetical protein
MEVRAEADYPVPPDAVFALLCDRAFRAAVCTATHAISHSVDVELRPDGAIVRMARVLPAEVPDFVKKFVGETLEVVQTEHWGGADASGGRTGSISVEVTGQPAGMEGVRRLEATAAGTHDSVHGEVRVRIPFFGGRIEPEIAAAIQAAIRKEAEMARRWLAE